MFLHFVGSRQGCWSFRGTWRQWLVPRKRRQNALLPHGTKPHHHHHHHHYHHFQRHRLYLCSETEYCLHLFTSLQEPLNTSGGKNLHAEDYSIMEYPISLFRNLSLSVVMFPPPFTCFFPPPTRLRGWLSDFPASYFGGPGSALSPENANTDFAL